MRSHTYQHAGYLHRLLACYHATASNNYNEDKRRERKAGIEHGFVITTTGPFVILEEKEEEEELGRTCAGHKLEISLGDDQECQQQIEIRRED